MMKSLLKLLARWSVLLIVLSSLLTAAPQPAAASLIAAPLQVYIPYHPNGVRYAETAIFWFGRITPTENHADVRLGYSASELYINVAIADRRLWYDPQPAPATLTAWDAVSLYLNLGGVQGAAPTSQAYRFDAQLNHWEPRTAYQAGYRGDGSGWSLGGVAFTATSGWRGDRPNNDGDDRGWTMTYRIPFSSLGLSAPPHGAVWGLAVAVHDRDDAAGSPIPTQTWPPAMHTTQPQSWGELVLGLPVPYSPPPAFTESRTLIREGLNGALVPDAPVGGHTTCGSGLNYWTQWGDKNYGNVGFFNVQNQSDIADWPCKSKYYVRFPLDLVPPNRVILGATVTLHQFGGAGVGWSPPAQRSLIQAYTVAGAWEEATLTWNNAPLAGRYVSATWVDPTDRYLGQPGKPWTWDVSAAVAEAYVAGQPLNLVFYESDAAYHSGKYFRTSEEEDFGAVGRPTLEVIWGDPYAAVEKSAQPALARFGDVVTYTLQVRGNNAALTLVDILPEGLSAPFSLSPGLDFVPPRLLLWQGQPGMGELLTLRYAVTVTTAAPAALRNEALILRHLEITTHALIVDARQLYLPLVVRGGSSPAPAARRLLIAAMPAAPQTGAEVTYTLTVHGDGQPLAVLATLPEGVALLGVFSSAARFVALDRVLWQGMPALGQVVTARYVVSVTAASGTLLTTHALLAQVDDSAAVTVLVNARQLYLPLVMR